jgi:ketosteroid isomerase-like protein
VTSTFDRRRRWGHLAVYCVLVTAYAVPLSGSPLEHKAPVAVRLSGFQRSAAKSDQETLIELEQRWNDAFYQKDVRFIESILADEFIATYDDGTRGDKAMELALAKEFNQHVTSAVQDEFTVKVYEDTAVVWFTLHMTGVRQGKQAEVTLHYTDVFVMRNGNWRCVSSQSTKIAEGK